MSTRKVAFKRPKRLFVIASEGHIHEPLYFIGFDQGRDVNYRLKVLSGPNRRSTPLEVVNRLIDYERDQRPGPDTEYWALVDRESWTEKEIDETWKLVNTRCHYYLALSNPCFELWLWLHFRPARKFENRRHCQYGLAHEWPAYTDHSYCVAPLMPHVNEACHRAKELDGSCDAAWPSTLGTSVVRLVEKLC